MVLIEGSGISAMTKVMFERSFGVTYGWMQPQYMDNGLGQLVQVVGELGLLTLRLKSLKNNHWECGNWLIRS